MDSALRTVEIETKTPPGVSYSILHTEWSSGWGGQGHRIILECMKVMALGHRVVIAAQPDSPLFRKALEMGIPVEPVRIRGTFDLLAIRDICRLIRKHGVTVVNTHSSKDTWVASLAAKLSGVPLLIRTRHISTPLSTNPLNFVHHLADGITTTGEMIREELIRVNRMSPDRVMSIPSGVSLERFDLLKGDGSKVRREFAIPDHSPLVVMVAVFRGMKRHDLLIAAVGLLRQNFPELKVLLAGKGTDSEGMKQLIAEAGLQDTVIAAGNRDDIPDVLTAADIVVLTSDRDEGVPQSLSQAMAMARPVVAAPVGGIPELVIDGETGLLSDIGNAGSFAANIERLLEDVGLRKRLGSAARQHVLENYTDDSMAEKTIAFYTRILAGKCLTTHRKANEAV